MKLNDASPSRKAMEVGRLPETGSTSDQVLTNLQAAKGDDFDWKEGTLPLYVYWLDEQTHELAQRAYQLFHTENGMGKKAFPSVPRLENEVISMALSVLGGNREDRGGSFTTGGTESIFLAVEAARNRGYELRQDSRSTRLNIVVPYSAHPAFKKAAEILDIDEIRVPLTDKFDVDITAMEQVIDENTVMLAGSAPSFPHGVFDDIPAIAAMASSRDIWMHVDACVGGMLAPFMREIGEPVPDFDLNVPGVCSLSVDIHKYGYAAKGASLLLLNEIKNKRYHRFYFDDWPRGAYSTATMLGTRPAGPVAAAWAVMSSLGHEGYRESARTIVATKERLTRGIDAIPGIEVIRPNDLSFVLYKSICREVDINAVADQMRTRGWFVGQSVEPVAIHVMLNPVHAQSTDRYLSDLHASVEVVRQEGLRGELSTDTY